VAAGWAATPAPQNDAVSDGVPDAHAFGQIRATAKHRLGTTEACSNAAILAQHHLPEGFYGNRRGFP
jgi:hypothetical protein